jgi:hypothetical protein
MEPAPSFCRRDPSVGALASLQGQVDRGASLRKSMLVLMVAVSKPPFANSDSGAAKARTQPSLEYVLCTHREEIMIQVRLDTDRQADALARSVMEEVADEYRSALDGITCPEHGKAPTIVISGRTMDTITTEFEICCEQLGQMVDDALAEEDD